MSSWVYAVWGASGGLMVEAVQFYSAIRRSGSWPWKGEGGARTATTPSPVVIRIGVGFGLAWAAAGTHQVSGPLGAIAVGIAAPLVIEQMAQRVPIDDGGRPIEGSHDES